jgi:hypothetical protein
MEWEHQDLLQQRGHMVFVQMSMADNSSPLKMSNTFLVPSRLACSLQPKRHPSPRPQIQNSRCTSDPRANSQFIQLPQRLRRHRTRQTPTPLRNRRHRLLDSLRRTPIIPMYIIPYPCINLIDMVGEVHRSGRDEEGEQRQYDHIWKSGQLWL